MPPAEREAPLSCTQNVLPLWTRSSVLGLHLPVLMAQGKTLVVQLHTEHTQIDSLILTLVVPLVDVGGCGRGVALLKRDSLGGGQISAREGAVQSGTQRKPQPLARSYTF